MSLLKISSFHSKICPSVLLLKINSFLFGVWPSVLLKYQLLPYLGFVRLYFAKYQLLSFWLRLRVAPLYLCTIIPYSMCHIIGLGCTQSKGAGIYPSITLIGPPVLCWRKGEKQVSAFGGVETLRGAVIRSMFNASSKILAMLDKGVYLLYFGCLESLNLWPDRGANVRSLSWCLFSCVSNRVVLWNSFSCSICMNLVALVRSSYRLFTDFLHRLSTKGPSFSAVMGGAWWPQDSN